MSYFILRLISHGIPCTTRCEFRRSISFLKKIYERRKALKTPSGFDIKDHRVLYHFTPISIFSTVRRFRYLKYATSVGILTTTAFFLWKGQVDPYFCSIFALIVVLHLLLILPLIHVGKNLVGKIYVHKNSERIAISYLNQNGSRTNICVNVNDAKISDHPNFLLRKLFKKVIIKDSDLTLNLCRYKVNVDAMLFETLFPDVL